MPLYEYLCSACAHRFERIVKFSDPPLKTCPKCGKETAEQLISAPAMQFKGSGWYVTDYARKSPASASSSAAKSEGSSDGSASASKESSGSSNTGSSAPANSGSSEKSSGSSSSSSGGDSSSGSSTKDSSRKERHQRDSK